MPAMTSCHARVARCHFVHNIVLRSNDHDVVRAALAGPCRPCSFSSVLQSGRIQLIDVAHIGGGLV